MNQRVIKKVRCNICSAGCPIDAYVEEGTLVSVEGSRDLPGRVEDYVLKELLPGSMFITKTGFCIR